MVQGTSPDPHENLAWAGLGIGHVAIADHIEITVPLKVKGFHLLAFFPGNTTVA
jgi:hypothetical protein